MGKQPAAYKDSIDLLGDIRQDAALRSRGTADPDLLKVASVVEQVAAMTPARRAKLAGYCRRKLEALGNPAPKVPT